MAFLFNEILFNSIDGPINLGQRVTSCIRVYLYPPPKKKTLIGHQHHSCSTLPCDYYNRLNNRKLHTSMRVGCTPRPESRLVQVNVKSRQAPCVRRRAVGQLAIK